jgi:secondary thiamine-phosphate synthase enzyme
MLEQTARPERVHRTQLLRQDATARVVTEVLELETTGAPTFHDITEDVNAIVEASGVAFGQVSVFSCHTTAAIRINEHEPLLLRDLARTLRQIAPSNAYYEHNDFGRRVVNMHEGEPANGHAHCQHLFLSTSETVPVIEGKAALGAYQSIFLIELDHPRVRQVMVTVTGCAAEDCAT